MPNREQRRGGAGGQTFDLKVDGVTYTLDPTAVSSAVEMELWQQSGQGLTLSSIGEALASGSPALFHVAAVVFLARRARGDQVTFAEVSGAITFGSEVDFDTDTDTDDGSGGPPEPPAADSGGTSLHSPTGSASPPPYSTT